MSLIFSTRRDWKWLLLSGFLLSWGCSSLVSASPGPIGWYYNFQSTYLGLVPDTKDLGVLIAQGELWAPHYGPLLPSHINTSCQTFEYIGADSCKDSMPLGQIISCEADYKLTDSCSYPTTVSTVRENSVNFGYVFFPKVDPIKNFGKPPVCLGDPCDPGTGNQYEKATDYSAGQFVPSFTRYYNSLASNNAPTSLGNWQHNYSRRIGVYSPLGDKRSQYDYATVTRADGKIYHFSALDNWASENDVPDTLTKTSTGWIYRLHNGTVETYNTIGVLLSETDLAGRLTTYSYGTGGLATITGPYGHTLTLGYASGRLVTLTDPNGKITRYGYNANNDLSTVTYPDGTGKQYHYEDPNFIHYLTGMSNVDAAGVVTRFSTFAYDAQGLTKLTQLAQTDNGAPQEKFTLTYPAPPTSSASYTRATDAANTVRNYSYSTVNGVKLPTQFGILGDVDTQYFLYDANNNLTCRYDSSGSVSYTYNSTNQRVSKTDNYGPGCGVPPANARVTTYQYLSPTLDLPTVIESPSVSGGSNKKRTTLSYTDPRFPTLPTSITQSGYTPSGVAVSRSVALTYTATGEVATLNGPRLPSDPGMNGVDDLTTMTYYDCTTGGACGQLKSVTNALGQTTTYDVYYADGRLQQKTDPTGLITLYSYDARGRVFYDVRYRSNNAFRYTRYTYTPFNQVSTAYVYPDNLTYTYGYDAAQDLRSITDSLGNTVNYAYDVKGNRTTTYSVTPGSTTVDQFTATTYNLRNQMGSVNQGGYLTQLVHDAVGNLTNETDPNHTAVASPASTQHHYDALNRLFQTTDLLNGNTRYAYDVNDHVTQVTTPNQAGTLYAYDDLGNLLQEVSPDRGTTTYTNDAAGNVISATDARNITVKYTYDPLNRAILTDYPNNPDVTTTYDATPGCTNGLGRVCTTQDGIQTVNYAYDAFDHLAQQTTTLQGHPYTTAYTRDPWGRVTGLTYPGGRVVNTPRDARGNLTSVSATVNGVTTTLLSAMTFRADGLLKSETVGNGLSDSRSYDWAGRLTTYSLGSADTRVYGYDYNGNLTSKQTLPEVASYGYDVLNELTTDNGPAPETLTYDANGNRQTRAGQSYFYLANSNRLTSVAGTPVTYDADGNLTTHPLTGQTFTYNEAGQLYTVSQGGVFTHIYLYNPQGLRTLNYSATTSSMVLYHYDDQGHLLQETDNTGTLLRAYVWADDVPVAQITKTTTGEVLTYLHTDDLNTPRLATDPTGKVVWRWEGKAFGDTAPNEDPTHSGVKTTINLRYAGQYYDKETGLHYNWHRYYDPRLGRYITSDPIGLAGGLNTYTYVTNNPLGYVDPYGLSKFDKFFGLPKQFWNWFHRHPDMKDLKGPDGQVPKDVAEQYHKEWNDLGRPGPDSKGGKDRGSADMGLLGWLIPWQITPTDIACAPGEDCETGPVPWPAPQPQPNDCENK